MHTPDLDPQRSAAALFSDIETYISEATRLMGEGEIVELAGLDDSVDALCRRVMDLRADEAQFFVPKLEALRTQLDGLQEAMETAKSIVRGELDASAVRQKATRAYRKPEEKK